MANGGDNFGTFLDTIGRRRRARRPRMDDSSLSVLAALRGSAKTFSDLQLITDSSLDSLVGVIHKLEFRHLISTVILEDEEGYELTTEGEKVLSIEKKRMKEELSH